MLVDETGLNLRYSPAIACPWRSLLL